jgi:endonuclease YncB( thermonuclease family)
MGPSESARRVVTSDACPASMRGLFVNFDSIRVALRRGAVFAGLLVLGLGGAASAEPMTRVFLNGVPTPVYFNDGDSFRVLSGPMQGTKTRLAGYNTLESFGPVHMFGEWRPYEMYVIAKMATLNARRGTWHCESDMQRDGYGRMLWRCPDLIKDQVTKGLAHAYSVNEEPADPEVLAWQRLAQSQRRGMWAKGIPEFIVTSLHSLSEDPTRDKHYNRAVSALDGHSAPWTHADTYDECQKVCFETSRVSPESALALAKRLLGDPELSAGLGEFTPELFSLVISAYARDGKVTPIVREPTRERLTKKLADVKAAGELGPMEQVNDSCHIYVDFKRRFGLSRAACLARH